MDFFSIVRDTHIFVVVVIRNTFVSMGNNQESPAYLVFAILTNIISGVEINF